MSTQHQDLSPIITGSFAQVVPVDDPQQKVEQPQESLRVVGIVFLDHDTPIVLQETAALAAALDAPFDLLVVQNKITKRASVGRKAAQAGDATVTSSGLCADLQADTSVDTPVGAAVSTATAPSFSTEQDHHLIDKLEHKVNDLGGNLVILSGDNDLMLVADYLYTHAVTDVVLSREPKPRIFAALRFKSPYHIRLAKLAEKTRVHLVKSTLSYREFQRSRASKDPFLWSVRLVDLVLVVIFVGLATGVAAVVQRLGLSTQISLLVYVLAIAVVSRLTPSYVPGVLAGLLSITLLNYLFVRPYFSFVVDQPANYLVFLVLLEQSFILSALSPRLQRSGERLRRREQRTHALYLFNREITAAHKQHDVIDEALVGLVRLLNRACVFYAGEPFKRGTGRVLGSYDAPDVAFFTKATEKAAADWAYKHRVETGVGTENPLMTDAYYVPAQTGDKIYGVLGVSCMSDELDTDDRAFLSLMSAQLALALEHQQASLKQKEQLRKDELDETRLAFVREISHEIQSLLEGAEAKEPQEMVVNAQAAHRVTRVMSKALARKTQEVKASDVVRAALERARKFDRTITVDAQALETDVPIHCEFELIAEALACLVIDAHHALMTRPALVAGDELGEVLASDELGEASVSDEQETQDEQVAVDSAIDSAVALEQAACASLDDLPASDAPPIQSSLIMVDCKVTTKTVAFVVLDEREAYSGYDSWNTMEFYIAKTVAEAHGGKLEQRDRLGGGVVTTLELER